MGDWTLSLVYSARYGKGGSLFFCYGCTCAGLGKGRHTGMRELDELRRTNSAISAARRATSTGSRTVPPAFSLVLVPAEVVFSAPSRLLVREACMVRVAMVLGGVLSVLILSVLMLSVLNLANVADVTGRFWFSVATVVSVRPMIGCRAGATLLVRLGLVSVAATCLFPTLPAGAVLVVRVRVSRCWARSCREGQGGRERSMEGGWGIRRALLGLTR
mmetsp:Transcript_232/g.472  ORF Transcript_232/g.472 Transcript_232/m.472 type:complete len:217 (-) Transcript_232:710-1360(-)